MARAERKFHFNDLLSLHLVINLPVPEGQGMMPLLHKITGVSLPMYPMPLVLIARKVPHEQYPWLKAIRPPRQISPGDWASVWAWTDTLQQRYGTPADGGGTQYQVNPAPPELLSRPVILIMEDPDDDA